MSRNAKSHLRTAWGLFKHHWRAFLLAQLAIVSAWIALEIAVVTANWAAIPAFAYWPLWLCLHLAFFWVFSGLMAGIHSMALQAVDGGVPTFTTAVSQLDRGTTYLFSSVLYWAAVVGGLCLAVIPGTLVAIRWSPFRFVLTDGTQTVLSSLHKAALLSTSRRWQVFRALVTSLALNLGGVALFGVGLLVAFPVTVLLRASHFRSLQRQQTGGPRTILWPGRSRGASGCARRERSSVQADDLRRTRRSHALEQHMMIRLIPKIFFDRMDEGAKDGHTRDDVTFSH